MVGREGLGTEEIVLEGGEKLESVRFDTVEVGGATAITKLRFKTDRDRCDLKPIPEIVNDQKTIPNSAYKSYFTKLTDDWTNQIVQTKQCSYGGSDTVVTCSEGGRGGVEACLTGGVCERSAYIAAIMGEDGQILLSEDEETGPTLDIHYDDIGVTGFTHKGKTIGSSADNNIEVSLLAEEGLPKATFQMIKNNDSGEKIMTNLQITTSKGQRFRTNHEFSSQD